MKHNIAGLFVCLICVGCSTNHQAPSAKSIEITGSHPSAQAPLPIRAPESTNPAAPPEARTYAQMPSKAEIEETARRKAQEKKLHGPTVLEKVKSKLSRDLYAPPTYKTQEYYTDLVLARTPDAQLLYDRQQLVQKRGYRAYSDPAYAIIQHQIDLDLQARRDVFVYKYAEIITDNFDTYVRLVTEGKAAVDTYADLVVLGINGAAAAVGAAETKTLLNIASAAFIGAKASMDKNFFMEKTIIVLAIAMEGQRRAQLDRIRGELAKPITNYSLYAAAGDLESLYSSGTMTKAFEQIVGQAQPAAAAAVLGVSTNPPPVFTTQPASPALIDHTQTAKVSAVAQGANVQYQWQYSSNGAEWKDCEAAPYSNFTTSTLTVTTPAQSLSGTLLRCVAKDAATKVTATSTIVVLLVK